MHSHRLLDLQVIHEWGGAARPSEYGLCEPDFDITMMAAYLLARGKMSAWENRPKNKNSKTRFE